MEIYEMGCPICKEVTLQQVAKFNVLKGVKLVCLTCRCVSKYHNLKLIEKYRIEKGGQE